MNAQPSIVPVTAGIIERSGKVLITQRQPTSRMAGLWEFPGGKVEAGETPEQCLQRELHEELGMDADIGPILGANIHHYDHISIRLMVYRAFWNGRPFKLVSHQAFRWVRPARLPAFAFTPADLPFVWRLAKGQILLD
ncbi:MAG: (deoxy)nucleoside triphosphate pyrophosphohydrolase [Desulfosarcina sp.]|jgi:8-oxo-dGTP diphosphatase